MPNVEVNPSPSSATLTRAAHAVKTPGPGAVGGLGRSLLRPAAKALLGLALALLTGNVIASWTCNCPTIFDPVLGRIPKPGASFRWRVEGNGSGVWTSNDVRRASLPDASSKGGVLILGDSYVEALHVRDDELFGHLLENRLFSNHLNIPILTSGKSGQSLADYVAKAPAFNKLFSPSWVVVVLNREDFCSDAWDKSKPSGFARFRRADPSGELEVVDSPPEDSGICGKVNDHLPFFLPITLFMQDRKGVVSAWLADNQQPWFHAEATPKASQAAAGSDVTNYPVEQELRMLSQAYNKRVTIFYLSPFDPGNPAGETPSETFYRKAADATGIHFISLRQKFPELAAEGRAPYGFSNTRFNSGHWNHYGHQAAADILFEDCPEITNALH